MKEIRNSMMIAGLSLALCGGYATAQTTPVSPEYNGKNVTFRLTGGNTVKFDGTTASKNNGVWQATKSKSGFFEYNINVDGMDVPDPGNGLTRIKREGNSSKSVGYGGEGNFPNVPRGTVHEIWVTTDGFGPNNCKSRRMLVYTPPGYETSGIRYPVLYVNHGWLDDEGAWFANGNIAHYLDDLIARGKVKPMIVVSGNEMTGDDAEPGHGAQRFIDFSVKTTGRTTGHGSYESHISKDMRPYMERNFRILTDKYSQAICGLSHGGGITMQMYINEPDKWGYIGLFSAANLQKFYNGQTSDDKLKAGYKNNPPKVFYMACGKDDSGQYPHNQKLDEKFKSLGLAHEVNWSSGGHNWGNWRNYINAFLPKLFPNFDPGSAAVVPTDPGDAIEAEDAMLVNGPLVGKDTGTKNSKGENVILGQVNVSSNSAFSGGKKVGNVGFGNHVDFTYSPKASGLYDLTIYYATNESRNIDITIDGRLYTTMACPTTGGWTTIGSQTISGIPMVKNTATTISLGDADGFCPDLDKISIYCAQTLPNIEQSYYIKNVGTGQYIRTGKDAGFDTPGLGSRDDATPQWIANYAKGTSTICDPKRGTDGWGVQGRNVIYESNAGNTKTNSWGTTLIPGWKFVPTGDSDGSVYIEYTWGTWTKGNVTITDPSNKTYALYYGDWALDTNGWSDSQKAEVANKGVYSDLASKLSSHGASAKWIVEPVIKSAEPEVIEPEPEPEPEPDPTPGTVTVTLSSYGQSTYSSPYHLDFTESSVQAYLASGYNAKNGKILMTRVQVVPAGVGVMLIGDEGAYEIPIQPVSKWEYKNMFVSVVEARTVSANEDEYVNYCLTVNESNMPAFYRIDGSVKLDANHAYLRVPYSVFNGEPARVLNYEFDDETTAIREINTDGVENARIYDLQGRRVAAPNVAGQKGRKNFYVVNGKKYVY